MKAVVVYTSQTGFTERYARWIAEAAGADCMELADAKKRSLEGYNTIIYGGWARAGSIAGLDWFKKNMPRWEGRKLVVFCVGGSPLENPDVPKALDANFTAAQRGRVDVFYCPGGFCYERMSTASRLAMRMFVKALKTKRNQTPQDREMAEAVSSSYDISDRRYIEPILACLGR